MNRQEAQTLLGHLEAATMMVAITGAMDGGAAHNAQQRAVSLQTFIRKIVLDKVCGGEGTEDATADNNNNNKEA